jgi:hypothetical protein
MFTIKVYGKDGYKAYSCKSYEFMYHQNDNLQMNLSPNLDIYGDSVSVMVRAYEHGDQIIYVENMIGKTIDRYVVKRLES